MYDTLQKEREIVEGAAATAKPYETISVPGVDSNGNAGPLPEKKPMGEDDA